MAIRRPPLPPLKAGIVPVALLAVFVLVAIFRRTPRDARITPVINARGVLVWTPPSPHLLTAPSLGYQLRSNLPARPLRVSKLLSSCRSRGLSVHRCIG